MARRDEGAYPPEVCDRGATKPAGLLFENPSGDGSVGPGLRWLGRYSPLRGCAGLAALAQPKIPRRRTPSNFQTGSQTSRPPPVPGRRPSAPARPLIPRRFPGFHPPVLLIPVRCDRSPLHGLGLFAVHPVPEGTPVWRFVPGFDRTFPVSEIAKDRKSVV